MSRRGRRKLYRCAVCGYSIQYEDRNLCIVCDNFVPDHIPEEQARRYIIGTFLKEHNHTVRFNKDDRLDSKTIDFMIKLME